MLGLYKVALMKPKEYTSISHYILPVLREKCFSMHCISQYIYHIYKPEVIHMNMSNNEQTIIRCERDEMFRHFNKTVSSLLTYTLSLLTSIVTENLSYSQIISLAGKHEYILLALCQTTQSIKQVKVSA
jgi:hypothetical protein